MSDGGFIPAEGTLERWAFDYVHSRDLAYKLKPPPVPEVHDAHARPLRIAAPGRPRELVLCWDKVKTPGTNALRDPKKRAALLHTFLHHELQAAELMCWAALAFVDAPSAFRKGLIGICLDEIRHMRMYEAHLESLGFRVGDFPVRDWFWQRAPAAETPAAFVALMGLGFEAGNLDHTQRFAERFREVSDERGARLQEVVGEEEVAHVAFAAHWFRTFAGPLAFERWVDALPPPLSPMVMRGHPLNLEARRRAGMDEPFLEALAAWQPESRGS